MSYRVRSHGNIYIAYSEITTAAVDPRWDNLAVGWKLNEESNGSSPVGREDVLENYTLTDNNTVPSTTGIIDNAASFTGANSECLSVDAGVGCELIPVGGGGSWTVSFWYVSDSDGVQGRYIVNADHGTIGAVTIICVQYHSPQRLWCYLYNTAGAQVNVQFSGDLVSDDWNHILLWSAGDNKLYGSANGGSVINTAAVAGTTRNFRRLGIGNRAAAPFNAGADTAIDEFYAFDVADGADSDWRSGMYNSGAGRSYPN